MRAAGLDECGLAQLGATVVAPFVGTICSVVVLAQLLKPLHGKAPNDRWRFDARSPYECSARENHRAAAGIIPITFVEAERAEHQSPSRVA